MTRRTFLALLPTAPVAVPAAVASVAANPWRAVECWSKEFDFGTRLSVAVRARNMLTGETTRNAARVLILGPRRGEAYGKAYLVARRCLRGWIDDLNTGMGQGPSWLGRWMERRRA